MKMLSLDELKKIDQNDPGSWPLLLQIIVGAVVGVAIIGGGWQLHIKNQGIALDKVVAKEAELKSDFETKQTKAANLNALKEQKKELEQSGSDMLRALPNKKEIAGLIVEISQAGLSAGLEFELFQPGKEQTGEYYAELPIEIHVSGTYHQFGDFISGIAANPRIVTTHNISIEPAGKAGVKGSKDKDAAQAESSSGRLKMKATARTYRALEEEEEGAS